LHHFLQREQSIHLFFSILTRHKPTVCVRKTLPKLPLITFARYLLHNEYLKRYLYRTHHHRHREPLKFVHY
jgi:hypothetical protein